MKDLKYFDNSEENVEELLSYLESRSHEFWRYTDIDSTILNFIEPWLSTKLEKIRRLLEEKHFCFQRKLFNEEELYVDLKKVLDEIE